MTHYINCSKNNMFYSWFHTYQVDPYFKRSKTLFVCVCVCVCVCVSRHPECQLDSNLFLMVGFQPPPKQFLYSFRLRVNSLVCPTANMQQWRRGKYHMNTCGYFRRNFNIKRLIMQELKKDRPSRLSNKSLERDQLASFVTQGGFYCRRRAREIGNYPVARKYKYARCL